MAQKVIQGDQLDLTDANGSVLTGVDADLLQGSNGAFYRDAGNLNAGTLLSARLTGTYNISISGNAATATSATSATTATTANNSLALGGSAAANWALLASPAFTGNPTAPTQTAGNNTTRLATTAFVQTAVGSGATVTSSGTLAFSGSGSTTTWNHLQATTPLLVNVHLINVIAQGGYTPGQIISLNHAASENDSGGGPVFDGIGVQLSTTQVIVRVAALRNIPQPQTSGFYFAPTAANWNMLIRIIT